MDRHFTVGVFDLYISEEIFYRIAIKIKYTIRGDELNEFFRWLCLII